MNLDRLDAEKRRRRLRLLAELADTGATRDPIPRPRARASQLRGLIANRRRLTTSV